MSNDLVVLDTNFKEVRRLKGIQGDSFGKIIAKNYYTKRLKLSLSKKMSKLLF